MCREPVTSTTRQQPLIAELCVQLTEVVREEALAAGVVGYLGAENSRKQPTQINNLVWKWALLEHICFPSHVCLQVDRPLNVGRSSIVRERFSPFTVARFWKDLVVEVPKAAVVCGEHTMLRAERCQVGPHISALNRHQGLLLWGSMSMGSVILVLAFTTGQSRRTHPH